MIVLSLNFIGVQVNCIKQLLYKVNDRNYFMSVPYIIDDTTLDLHGLASYYCSTVHFNPLQSNKSSMHYNHMAITSAKGIPSAYTILWHDICHGFD